MQNLTIAKTSKVTDPKVLADIYELYNAELYRYASRMLSESSLAEDCVSETFSRFLLFVKKGGTPENVRAFLYRTAHNWVIDHYRSAHGADVQLDDDYHADNKSNPDQIVPEALERQRMRNAMQKLSSDQRMVLELRFLEDWSHEEVAEVLGKTIEATRILQHRALASLRQLMSH